MRHDRVMGLLFPNMHDEVLPELTSVRALGSVPFGGRYRLIDFPLSNLVNAGVSKVGIISKSNYQSLMDHLGSGKAWDLSRKSEGLYILPPFGIRDEQYEGRIASLQGILPFLINSKEEYVILSDCQVVGNIDYRKIVDTHVASGADVTMACLKGLPPTTLRSPVVKVGESGRIMDMIITNHGAPDSLFGIGLYVISRRLLMQYVDEASSRHQTSFEWDILQRHVGDRRLYAYQVSEYVQVIVSLDTYFRANYALLDNATRQKLFLPKRQIYTKIRDCEPALYGLHAQVTGSLVADGCKIEGTVHNSILFRNVQVDRHAVVENSIVMQGSVIGGSSHLEYVITDKNVCVRDGRSLKGCADYLVAIRKGTMV